MSSRSPEDQANLTQSIAVVDYIREWYRLRWKAQIAAEYNLGRKNVLNPNFSVLSAAERELKTDVDFALLSIGGIQTTLLHTTGAANPARLVSWNGPNHSQPGQHLWTAHGTLSTGPVSMDLFELHTKLSEKLHPSPDAVQPPFDGRIA